MSDRRTINGLRTSLAGAGLAVALGGGAGAQTFDNAPIACGAQTPFKTCTAAFDGRQLRITYANPEGKPAVAVYRMCEVIQEHINCAAGEWRSGDLTGPLGGRTIALKDGLPFRE